MRRPVAYAPFLLLIAMAACKRMASDRQEHSSAPRAPAAPSSRAALADVAQKSAPSSSTTPGNTSPPALPEVAHCKALGKRGQVPISTVRDSVVALVSERDHIFAFTYQRELARVTLLRIQRDGSSTEVVGRHTAAGEPTSPVLGADAAYFLRNQSLIRMPRDGGDAVELAKGFSGAIAVDGEHVYGISCDDKTPSNSLLRLSTQGGEVERIATIHRPKASDGAAASCGYHSLLADATAVYAASWNTRQILRIALADGAVTPLVTKKAFPSSLAFEGGDLLFQASDGLYRVSKSEPSASRISKLGSAPFTFVVHDGPVTYVHQIEPYMPEEWSYELVRSTGNAKKIELYRALDPSDTPPDTGIRALAVDDECLYTARQQKSGVVLFARSRQSL